MWGKTTLPSYPHPSSQRWSTLFTQPRIHLTSITEAVSDVSLNQGTESSMSIFHMPDPMLDARDAGMKEIWFMTSISSRLRRSQTHEIATVLVLLMGFESPKEWTEKSHSDQKFTYSRPPRPVQTFLVSSWKLCSVSRFSFCLGSHS